MFKTVIIIITLSLYHLITYGQQWGDYTLYSTQNSAAAYLVDTNGTAYHTWSFSSSAKTGYSSYLERGGTIVRTVSHQGNSFNGGGACGQVQKVDWGGNVTWNYVCSTTTYCSHHDICPIPNGNVLIIAWELKSAAQVTQAGCKWAHIMWPEMILEVQPSGSSGGIVVWEWHAWDHLVQDYDASKDNYGVVADHPGLLDLNYGNSQQTTDWMHCNGIDYNPQLDQIVFSSHFLNELYVIDHSTTTAEAAGHSGGNSGKGGDFLYRWGNPVAYDASGTSIFHVVHDAHWIPAGCPNAGYLVGFNNNGISNQQSCIDLISPPYNGYNYELVPGSAYAPSTYTWRHACNGHSADVGASQQLPNGNMLISITQSGLVYEINASQVVLWQKTINGGVPNARRYSKCYVEGTTIAAPTISLQGDSLVASYGVTFQWYLNGSPITGTVHHACAPSQSGSYQVKIADAGGCESDLSNPYNYNMEGIPGIENQQSSSVYPVPSSGIIYLDENIPIDHIRELSIFEQSGRLVMKTKPTRTIDLTSLENGVYFMVATGDKPATFKAKIVLIK
jgi:hypothetical protein